MRRPTNADVPAIVRIASDWEVASRLSRMPHPYTLDHARFFLEHVVTSALAWLIVDRASEGVVGVIGLTPGPDARNVEIGYYLGAPDWGRGLATEAGEEVVRFAFEVLGCNNVTSGYHADNTASGRVLAKLGFRPTGSAVRPSLTLGTPQASVEVRVDRDCFRASAARKR